MSYQTIAGTSYVFSYGYNLVDALISETYPSGRTVQTNYDQVNRATEVSGTFAGVPTQYVTGATYAAGGGPARYVYGNQVARSYMYSAQLQALMDANQSDTAIFQQIVTWGITTTPKTSCNGAAAAQNDGTVAGIVTGQQGAGDPWDVVPANLWLRWGQPAFLGGRQRRLEPQFQL